MGADRIVAFYDMIAESRQCVGGDSVSMVCWEGEAPAEPNTTGGRRPPEARAMPPADAELKLVLGSAGASPSQLPATGLQHPKNETTGGQKIWPPVEDPLTLLGFLYVNSPRLRLERVDVGNCVDRAVVLVVTIFGEGDGVFTVTG